MSSKRLVSLAMAAAILLAAPSAEAIYLNTETFRAAGGNPNNIAGTIAQGSWSSWQRSLQAPFDAVGLLPGCTGTWLGNDDRHAWVLTAAHCVGAGSHNYSISLPTVSASGASRVYWPPNWTSGISSDIALVSIPLQVPHLPQWNAVTKPFLHDGTGEVGRATHLAGHGVTGIGDTQVWTPNRRLWGTTRVVGAYAGDAGLVVSYAAHGKTDLQARTAPGDSGSAWWQQHAGGYWSIVAVTSTGNSGGSNGTRVNRHVDWIKGVFPGASLFSERFTVTDTQPFVSRNHADDVDFGIVYYLVAPNQPHVVGPTAPTWSSQWAHSRLTVMARDAISGKHRQVFLRAWRSTGCRDVLMESVMMCHILKMGPLRISYHAEDNAGLPSGEWKASFDVEAIGWHRDYRERLPIKVDIRNLVQGRVQRDKAWQSPNFASHASRGTVYYLVPPQAKAVGPTSPIWSGQPTHSTISVVAREASTGFERLIVLRATRNHGCGNARMQDGVMCNYAKMGPLTVAYHAADNTGLPVGKWRGVAYVRAKGWHDHAVDEAIRLDVAIDR